MFVGNSKSISSLPACLNQGLHVDVGPVVVEGLVSGLVPAVPGLYG